MLCFDIGMVAEHEALVFQNNFCIISAEERGVLSYSVREVAEIVDQAWNQDKENHTEQYISDKSAETSTAFLP